MNAILRKYVGEFRSGRNLNGGEAELFLDSMISESDEAILAEIFRAWNQKGIDEDEIYSIAKVMRGRCANVVSKHTALVDIVGTGGSRSKTFNVSTAAAFVVAAHGIPVAKHGNKAATSNSGSADVLAELGIRPSCDPESAARSLNELNLCFMFAPGFHRLSPTLAKVRRGLGFPTIFNCVGPLCNPANAPHQLIGVWNPDLVNIMANVLMRLGTARSWVVHGHNGLDEISISGPTAVAEVAGGSVRLFDVSPEDFGACTTDLNGCRADSPGKSAAIIRDILDGKDSAARSMLEINAGVAIYISGGGDLPGSVHRAADAIRSGAAANKLAAMAAASMK